MGEAPTISATWGILLGAALVAVTLPTAVTDGGSSWLVVAVGAAIAGLSLAARLAGKRLRVGGSGGAGPGGAGGGGGCAGGGS